MMFTEWTNKCLQRTGRLQSKCIKYLIQYFLVQLHRTLRHIIVRMCGTSVQYSSITRGHNLKLTKVTCCSRIRHNCFSQWIVNYWNELPRHVVNATSLNSFKNHLNKHRKAHVHTGTSIKNSFFFLLI